MILFDDPGSKHRGEPGTFPQNEGRRYMYYAFGFHFPPCVAPKFVVSSKLSLKEDCREDHAASNHAATNAGESPKRAGRVAPHARRRA